MAQADRTAESLSEMPFQPLERGELPPEIHSVSWSTPTGASVPNNFGAGRSYNEGHEGADIGGAPGSAVVAASAGTVVFVLRSCPNDNRGRNRLCGNGWGNHVVLRHAGHVHTRYAHLGSVTVKLGDVVAQEARVGTLGNSGLSDGPHLHFELGVRQRSFDGCGAPQNFDRVYDPAKLPFGRGAQWPRGCRVTSDGTNVRATPGGAVVATLNAGASVTALREAASWSSVSFRLGGRDWGTAREPAFVHASLLSCR